MAHAEPCLISELCEQFEIDLYDLLICCIFCRRHLEDFEKWSFMNKCLNVVWRNGFPFAICNKCTEVRALVDLLRHFERSGTAGTVEEDTGRALGDLRVRCIGCFKPLTATEKLFHVEDGRPFTKVANNWRGCCTNCLVLPPRLVSYFTTVSAPRTLLPDLTWGFDRPPARLSTSSESDTSSWTTTSASSATSGRRTPTDTQGGGEGNITDAESDGETETLI
nr:MAG: E6 protein [Neophocaena asiaeorientalis asiaeorientalis papillomavirus 5]